MTTVVPRGRLRLALPSLLDTHPDPQGWVDDPAQVALVSARGFSGPVWRQLPRLEPALLSWTDPPQWLPQDLAFLAAPKALAPRGEPGFALVALAAPRLFTGPAASSTISYPSLSTVSVEGDLARRRKIDAPQLPSWPHPDVLLPTTVQTVVDRDGLVLSATLLTRSGHPGADQKALETALATRFEPAGQAVEAPVLTWGQLVFRWQVVPLGTNVP